MKYPPPPPPGPQVILETEEQIPALADTARARIAEVCVYVCVFWEGGGERRAGERRRGLWAGLDAGRSSHTI